MQLEGFIELNTENSNHIEKKKKEQVQAVETKQ